MNMMAIPLVAIGDLPVPGQPPAAAPTGNAVGEGPFAALLDGSLRNSSGPGPDPNAMALLMVLLADGRQTAMPQQIPVPAEDTAPGGNELGAKPAVGATETAVENLLVPQLPQRMPTEVAMTDLTTGNDSLPPDRVGQLQQTAPVGRSLPTHRTSRGIRIDIGAITAKGTGQAQPGLTASTVEPIVGQPLPQPLADKDGKQSEPVMSLAEKRFAHLLGDRGRQPAQGAEATRATGQPERTAPSPTATKTGPLPAHDPVPKAGGSETAADPGAPPFVIAPATGRSETPQPAPAAPAAPPERSLHLASGDRIAERVVVDQVVSHFGRSGRLESGQASLRLYPEELGEVRLDIDIRDNRISATLQTQSHQVQDVLNRHLDSLRHALEHQGLRVDRIEVRVAAESPHAGGQEQPFSGHFSGQQSAGHFSGQFFQRSGHQAWQQDFGGWPHDTLPENPVKPEPIVNRPAPQRAGLSLRV
ncbi:flagellar hook-length control protein FliK [Geothermobacter ehrlichii]|uniref:Flagellar hook-length control protein FliK n=1 Tax=Geothermobacter ehrlichii TaxID=213224 RepID=A0A5D3WPR3_9BACT|nr:flagellar hook-length control protein FliK [Geothermobacter ehrlichii]TYP00207.1 flagellar hook-length control protein FliK [Geothermobacter ehrlichii]